MLTVVPYKKCGFTYKDLAPVAQVNVFTMGWGVRADSGIASVQDLMDKAKAERGKYSLASPGAFTAQRFYHANVMKLFPESDLPYVAYNGGAEIVTALLGNHISAGFTPVVNFKPHKDIRVIAVCGAQRDPNYPDAPTFKEMFGDGFVFDSVYGIVAPLRTTDRHRTPPEPDQGSPQRSRRAGQVRQGQHDHQLPPRRRIRQGHRRVLQAL
ncbi:MAG: tripartite tricarboxylate transporter substrate-binding protein [Bilophila wadsworthia]